MNPSVGDGRLFSRESLVVVLICAALGFDFPYYPIFAAFILLAVGPFMAYRLGSWRPVVRAVGMIGLIAAFFIANLLPNIVYRLQHGKNHSETLATIRHWSHAEMFGLKIAPMLLAAENHPIKSWDRKRQKYLEGTVAYSSGSSQALGSISALGFMALVGWLLIKQNRGRREADEVMDVMSVMNIACLLLATVGGFSAIANLLSVGVLRGYDRISIFIMFFSLIPIGLGLMRCRVGPVRTGAVCRLLWIADRDLPGGYVRTEPLLSHARRNADCRVPVGQAIRGYDHSGCRSDGRVFQYPVQNFLSQAGPAIRWDPYTHFRGYAHSSTLTWSFGAVVGRAPAQVQNWIESLAPAQAIETLALMDFGGIYVDRKLFDDHGAKFEAALQSILGAKSTDSRDGRLAYYSLKGYQQSLQNRYTPEELAARREAVCQPVIAEWDSIDAEEVYPTERFRWCQGKSARLCLINLSKAPQTIRVKFAVCTSQDPEATMKLSGVVRRRKWRSVRHHKLSKDHLQFRQARTT